MTPPPRLRPGLIAAALVLAVYGGMAVSIDVPRTTLGIHSDEATYYLIGHSIAADFDLEYRREDLLRSFAEYPSGPSGVFLKKGQTLAGQPDPDQERLYFGKAFVYPLFAAPFVKVFGTNGFFLLNALLMAAVVLAAYAFLSARSSPAVSLVLALAFVFATVVPVYAVWIAPELFNFALGCLAYFCWLYKEVAPAGRSKWLRDGRSDLVAAGIVGLLAFSKVSNALLVVPIVAWLMWRREWKRAVLASVAFWIVMLSLFGVNVATSGDWNYQGGQINGEPTRNTFYPRSGGAPGYPFERPGAGFEVGHEKAVNAPLTDIIFDENVFVTNVTWNSFYVFVGRHTGLVPYFFPAVFAMGAFLWLRRRRAPWQWLVLASGLAQILLFMIWQPYTWNGSGGSVGNRYFMSAYGIFVFLLPPIHSIGAALVPVFIGLVFTGKLVLNPFHTSFHPSQHSWRGPIRMFPVERTLVLDIPINTDPQRVRIWFGADPRFQIYYLDDNSYFREPDDAFWVRGDSRADILVKTDQVVRALQLGLRAGPSPVKGTVRVGWKRYDFDLQPGELTTVGIELGAGFPYQGTRVWNVSIAADGGFLPRAYGPSDDTRYLGVKVFPVLVR